MRRMVEILNFGTQSLNRLKIDESNIRIIESAMSKSKKSSNVVASRVI